VQRESVCATAETRLTKTLLEVADHNVLNVYKLKIQERIRNQTRNLNERDLETSRTKKSKSKKILKKAFVKRKRLQSLPIRTPNEEQNIQDMNN